MWTTTRKMLCKLREGLPTSDGPVKKIPPRVLADYLCSHYIMSPLTWEGSEDSVSTHSPGLGWESAICCLAFPSYLGGCCLPVRAHLYAVSLPMLFAPQTKRVWTLRQAMVAVAGLSASRYERASASFPGTYLAFSSTSLVSLGISLNLNLLYKQMRLCRSVMLFQP